MVQAIAKCDILLCESISAAQRLCQHAQITPPKLKRYWAKNEQAVLCEIEKSDEQCIGLISDAGTPLISDPGYGIVKLFHDRGWQVKVVPGPTALISALVLSGMPTHEFGFYGFLLPKSAGRKKELRRILQTQMTWVAYESPRRVLSLCQDIEAVFGSDHYICVIKEMTKIHETIWRGAVSDVIGRLSDANLKGEFVVVGAEGLTQVQWQQVASDLMQELSLKRVSGIVSQLYGVSKSQVYDFLLEVKK
jgi:16S rRNA (cytidine1402-2'-O)-methyltransferase